MVVKREKVVAGDEDETVRETNKEGAEVGTAFEDAEGNDGVDGESLFDEEENADYNEAEDDEAYYGCRGPGVGDSAEGKTKEEHYCAADY